MNKVVAFLLLMVIFTTTYSQGEYAGMMLPDLEWGQGSVMLNDGTELKGMLKYNDKVGMLSFENGSDSRSFTARGITGFEFFDEKVQRQRVFYTLEYMDEEREAAKRPYLFEVLKEFSNFAVVSKIDPVVVTQSTGSPGAYPLLEGTATTSTKIILTESVFVLTSDGDIKPYLKLIRYIHDKTMFDIDKTKRKIVDRKLHKAYFIEPGYSKMLEYIKREDLDMEDKEDFIKALSYYKDVMKG